MDDLNQYLISQFHEVYLPLATDESIRPVDVVGSVVAELQRCGFEVDDALLYRIQHTSAYDVLKLMTVLHTMFPVKAGYEPLFSDFPQKKMATNDAAHFIIQINEYFGHTRKSYPNTYAKQSTTTTTPIKLTVVTQLANRLEAFLMTAMQQQTVWSIMQRELVFHALTVVDDPSMVKDVEIPIKENSMALVAMLEQIYGLATIVSYVKKQFKTATDVLRYALAINDLTLFDRQFNLRFKRPQIEFMLSLLDHMPVDDVVIDMYRHERQYKRLMERLHPMTNKHKQKYQNAYKAFYMLANNKRVPSISSHIESARQEGNTDLLLILYRKRPSEFARAFVSVVGICGFDDTFDAFLSVVDDVPTRILISLQQVFKTKDYGSNRTALVSGAYRVIPQQNVRFNDSEISQMLNLINDVLIDRFEALPALDTVVVDESFKNVPVPLYERETTIDINSLPRLTHMPLPSGDVLRTFISWTNGVTSDPDSRIDLDHSIVCFDDTLQNDLYCSYNTGFRLSDVNQTLIEHSGDVTNGSNTNGVNGVEYVDLHLNALRAAGYRYIVTDVRAYTKQSFDTMFEANYGYMVLDDDNTYQHQLIDYQNVEHTFALTAPGIQATPLIIDLFTNEIIWVNSRLQGSSVNLTGASDVGLIAKRLATRQQMSVSDLFALHVAARGGTMYTVDEYNALTDKPTPDIYYAKPTKYAPLDMTKLIADLIGN